MAINYFNTGFDMIDPFQAAENERRRREEQERLEAQQRMQLASAAPVKPTPVKETITTDPVTGERRIRIEGSERDLSAMNPLTPTVTMPSAPVSPEDIQRDQREQFVQRQTAAPAVMPAAPVTQPVAAPAPQPQPQQQTMVPSVADLQATARRAMRTADQAMQPVDYDNIILGAYNNDRIRTKMLTDSATPPDYRMAAIDMDRDIQEQRRKEMEAKRIGQDMLRTGNMNQFARELQKRGEEGSLVKAIFYRAVGLDDLAAKEQGKLGAGAKYVRGTDAAGNPVLLRQEADGMPTKGWTAQGQSLTPDQLAGVKVSGFGTGKVTTSGTFFETPQGQILRAQTTETGDTRLIDAASGAVYSGSTAGLRSISEAGGIRRLDYGVVANLRQRFGEKVIEAAAEYEKFKGPMSPQDRSDFFQAYGMGQGVPGQAPAAAPALPPPPPAVTDGATPVPVRPDRVSAAPIPPATGTGAGQQQGPAALQANTGQQLAGGPRPAAGGITTPTGDLAAQRNLRTRAGEAEIETAQVAPRENVRANLKAAQDAAAKAKEGNAQLSTLDRVIRYTETHPRFFGDWIGGEAFRAFTAAQTDEDRRVALERLAQSVNIDKNDRPEFQKLLNDIARLELSGITSSGLAATQLNTERESQRAVNAFAVNIRNQAEAARAQAEIAKAQVQYNREFNRYVSRLSERDQRQSPAKIQDDFDTKIGDKIYDDLRKKLEGASGAQGNTGQQDPLGIRR